jgi:hypothetical protein
VAERVDALNRRRGQGRAEACPDLGRRTASSTTRMHFENMSWPSPQMACITLRAWPVNDLRIETTTKLWKMPSTGKSMSTISGRSLRRKGRKRRSEALPR